MCVIKQNSIECCKMVAELLWSHNEHFTSVYLKIPAKDNYYPPTSRFYQDERASMHCRRVPVSSSHPRWPNSHLGPRLPLYSPHDRPRLAPSRAARTAGAARKDSTVCLSRPALPERTVPSVYHDISVGLRPEVAREGQVAVANTGSLPAHTLPSVVSG